MKANRSKIAEDYQSLSHRIFSLANRGVLRIDFIHKITMMLLDFSACDAVELRMRERSKYYRCEYTKNPGKPFQFEILPVNEDGNLKIISDAHGESDVENLCINVIQGRLASPTHNQTRNGSFWTGDTSRRQEVILTPDGQVCSYNLSGDYRSLSIIPLQIEEGNTGLLQLKSKEKDFFTRYDIELYEGVAQTLGVALVDRRSQVALRERVKELTCLYGIAKIVARPNVSVKDMMQGIVEILPQAWLYPDIASARIILNDQQYISSRFQEGCHKQSAPITVEGKKRGEVEIVYSETRPELDDGPFLREERNLIDTIARELALVLQRKQTETEKIRLQDQLRHADRLATIGQLAAGVAHELNEPLANILGFSQLVMKDPELTESIRKDVERIEKSSLHAREIIRKLMTFAHQTPPKQGKVNLNTIVEEGLSFIESRCAKEGIALERILSPDIPDIPGDQAQIHQVLVNLTVNAIQAMPKGGQLTIRTTAANNNVSLIIEDSGIGMSEDVMEQIFVPFFTTKEVGQGTGLGLAVVHGIVMSHGGSIQVDSKVGHGTRFVIQLPIN